MFIRVFKIKKWKFFTKRIVIRYEEGTIKDYIDFRKTNEGNGISIWLYNFFKYQSKNLTFSDFLLIIGNDNLSKILDDIIKTRFEGMFKVNSDEGVKESETTKLYENAEFLFKFKNFLCWIAKEMCIDYKTLISNYTVSELFECSEHYIFNENEKSEGGQETNRKKLKLLKISEMKKYNIL